MSTFPIKPLPVTAPVLNEDPAADEWGQLVRHVGEIDANIVGGSVDIAQPTISVVTAIPKAVVSTLIAAANVNRRGLTIYNDSNRNLFLRVAPGPASTTNWTVRLRRNDYYELPFPVYTGEVTAVWAAGGSGDARVTELSVVP